MTIVYQALGGLLLLLVLFVGGAAFGSHRQKQEDQTAALAAYNKAVVADATRIKLIDTGTLKLDADYHAQINLVLKVQSANVQEQAHVIQASPALAMCKLPAALLRLRSEQATASAALASPSPSK